MLCVICQADLHARNLIRDQEGQVFVIDWDEVMLAPKERDFIFIREPQAEFLRAVVSPVLRYQRVFRKLDKCSTVF